MQVQAAMMLSNTLTGKLMTAGPHPLTKNRVRTGAQARSILKVKVIVKVRMVTRIEVNNGRDPSRRLLEAASRLPASPMRAADKTDLLEVNRQDHPQHQLHVTAFDRSPMALIFESGSSRSRIRQAQRPHSQLQLDHLVHT